MQNDNCPPGCGHCLRDAAEEMHETDEYEPMTNDQRMSSELAEWSHDRMMEDL